MGLETATYISGLNSANPVVGDNKTEGDDHIRLLKSMIQATFPNITGAVTATHTELNQLDTNTFTSVVSSASGFRAGTTGTTGVYYVMRYTDGANYWSVGPLDTTATPQLDFYCYGTAQTCMKIAGSGDVTVLGLLKANNGGSGLGQITVSTSAPSGGADGDLWLRYE